MKLLQYFPSLIFILNQWSQISSSPLDELNINIDIQDTPTVEESINGVNQNEPNTPNINKKPLILEEDLLVETQGKHPSPNIRKNGDDYSYGWGKWTEWGKWSKCYRYLIGEYKRRTRSCRSGFHWRVSCPNKQKGLNNYVQTIQCINPKRNKPKKLKSRYYTKYRSTNTNRKNPETKLQILQSKHGFKSKVDEDEIFVLFPPPPITATQQSEKKRCNPTPEDVRGPFYVKKEYILETNCIAFDKESKPGSCENKEYQKSPMLVKGRILDSNCEPVEGAIIHYWQAAPEWSESYKKQYTMIDSTCTGVDGTLPFAVVNCVDTEINLDICEAVGLVPDCISDMDYKAYRGWQSTVDGNYELYTVPPGIYDLRPIRHIHIEVTVPGKKIGGKPEFITQVYFPQNYPTKNQNDLFEFYMEYCELYRIRPGQWAKKQKLDVCPIRHFPEGEQDLLQTYTWDIILDMS